MKEKEAEKNDMHNPTEGEKEDTQNPTAEEKLKETSEKENQEKQPDAESLPAHEEKNEIINWEEKCSEWEDKYIRLYAEFENYKKRNAKEKLELIRTATEELIIQLLPVLDDFERGLQNISESNDLATLKQGYELIYQKLMDTLNKKGLSPIESSKGKTLDIAYHNAIAQIPVDDPDMKGKIIDEIEKGYVLNGKIIRHTKVVVGQ